MPRYNYALSMAMRTLSRGVAARQFHLLPPRILPATTISGKRTRLTPLKPVVLSYAHQRPYFTAVAMASSQPVAAAVGVIPSNISIPEASSRVSSSSASSNGFWSNLSEYTNVFHQPEVSQTEDVFVDSQENWGDYYRQSSENIPESPKSVGETAQNLRFADPQVWEDAPSTMTKSNNSDSTKQNSSTSFLPLVGNNVWAAEASRQGNGVGEGVD